MALTNETPNQCLNVLVLAETASERIQLRQRLMDLDEFNFSLNLIESTERGLEVLRTKPHDIVFLDEPFFKQLECRDIKLTDRTTRKNSRFVVIHDAPEQLDDSFFQEDIDSFIPPEKLNTEFVKTILAPGVTDETIQERSADNSNLELYSKEHLYNYVKRVNKQYVSDSIQGLIVFLEIADNRLDVPNAIPVIYEFFESLGETINRNDLIDQRIGEYGEGIFWGFYTCDSIPGQLKRSILSLLMEIRDSILSENSSETPRCNAVVQQLNTDSIPLDPLLKSIDRTLNRAKITPGPSVIIPGRR